MRLTRVYLAAALRAHDTFDLPKETAAHVVKVLRARVGDELVLFNGSGREYPATIDRVRSDRVSVVITQELAIDRESMIEIVLVQAVPRGDRMDFVVQKATELGVSRIVPVLSRRSVVRLDERQSISKLEHWRAVAISACEQCGRNRVPEITAPLELLAHFGAASCAQEYRIVLDPLAESAARAMHAPRGIEITIGPEGGFDPLELDAMRIARVQGVRLGPRVLRTETAALAAVTWLQTRFGDFRSATGG